MTGETPREARAGARQAKQTQTVSGSGTDYAVITALTVGTGVMKARRIRYSDNPPVVGNYEFYGAEVTCYPFPTSIFEHWELFVYGGSLSTACLAVKLRLDPAGYYTVEPAFKINGSILPADEPTNECSFG